jgi:iron complex transport system ATP-binding protein
MSAALRARGLHVRLGGRTVLADIDIDVEPGCLSVVIGPNGAGKTTLLRALAGLVALAGGTVHAGTRALRSLSAGERGRTIAYLPQYLPQSGGIAWPISAASIAALGRMPHGERSDALPEKGRRAVESAIAAVGLQGLEMRLASELSGGERARVLLARMLATEAPVMLADEPVAAFDPGYQLRVLDVLKERARVGAAVVAVMHDLALAARFADRIIVLDGGRIVAAGAPRDVLTMRRLADSFGMEALITERDGALVVTPWRAVEKSTTAATRATGTSPHGEE